MEHTLLFKSLLLAFGGQNLPPEVFSSSKVFDSVMSPYES